MRQFDFLIAGGGVLGLTTAYEIIKDNPELKVAIISPEQALGAATFASGAMLGCFGEVTSSSFSSEYHRAKFNICYKATKSWVSYLEEINSFLPKNLQANSCHGTHIFLNSKAGRLDSKNYASIINALDEYHEPYQRINVEDIQGFSPSDEVCAYDAIYVPQENAVDSRQFMHGLRWHLQNTKQVVFVDACVEKVNVTNGQFSSLKVSTGEEFSGKEFVIAAGAYSQEIIQSIPSLRNRVPRLFYGAGAAMLIDKGELNLKNTLRTPNRSFSCGLHVIPVEGDAIYLGATNLVLDKPETTPRLGHINFLSRCLMSQINKHAHKNKALELLGGYRPVSFDTFPLVGKTSIKGVSILTGTYRDGFQQSPLLSRYMARKLLHDEDTFDNCFLPERMPIQAISKSELFDSAVEHYLSCGYEQDMRLPVLGWEDMVRDMFVQRIEELNNKLDIDYILSPDLWQLFEENCEDMVRKIRTHYLALSREHSCIV